VTVHWYTPKRTGHALECQLMEMAKPVILGVVSAQQADNAQDAATLISHYQDDARSLGASLGTSWAMLFSASTLWVSALVEMHAEHHDQTPEQSVTSLALSYARGASSDG